MDSAKTVNVQCYICNAVFDDNHKLWQHINEENCERSTLRNVLGPIGNKGSTSVTLPGSLSSTDADKENVTPQTDKLSQLLSDSLVSSLLLDQSVVPAETGRSSPSPSLSTASLPAYSSFCHVCMVPLPTWHTFKAHITGKRHLKNARQQPDQANTSAPQMPLISDTSTTSVNTATPKPESAMSQPQPAVSQPVPVSASQKSNPAKRLPKPSEPSIDVQAPKRLCVVPVTQAYFCDLCGVSAPTQTSFSLHLRGKRHAFMLNSLKRRGVQITAAAAAATEKRQPTQTEAPAHVKPAAASSRFTVGSAKPESPNGGSSAVPSARPATSSASTDPAHSQPSTFSSPPPTTLDLRPVLRQLCLTQIVSLLSNTYSSCPDVLQSLMQSGGDLMNNGLPTERLLANLVQTIGHSTGTSLADFQTNSPSCSAAGTGRDLLHNLMLLCWSQQLMLLLPERNQQQRREQERP